jgi:PEP-CTERM motif
MKKGSDNTIALGALAGITLLLGGVETAYAGTVNSIQSFTIGPTSGSASGLGQLSFQPFMSSLGTLTGISFTLTSDVTTSVQITGPANEISPSGSATNNTSFSVVVENSPDITLFSTTGSASASCSDFSCTNTGTTGPVAFDGTFDVAAADFALFEGSGDVAVDLNYANDAMVTACNPSFGMCTASGSLLWDPLGGGLELSYHFTSAAAAPEPSSLALFGSALLCFAGFGSRRRKEKATPLAQRLLRFLRYSSRRPA